MRDLDFLVHYEALGLEPGASDQEIARAKRAYNELYHSDRLAHMSGAAQAIAAQKVRAANEAARVLLDPSRRGARDHWARERATPGGARRAQPEASELRPDPGALHPDAPRPARRVSRGVKLAIGSVAVGAVLGAGAFLIRGRSSPRPVIPAHLSTSDTTTPVSTTSRLARRDPPPNAVRPIVDSVITVPGDGGWSALVPVGGASFRASFIPESDNVMYRVRTNGTREYVLNSEPGFRRITEEVRSFEWSSLTGKSLRVRYTRWLRNAPSGATVHTRNIVLPADGSWSQRIWLGPLGTRWDVDRPVGYEVRDDEGRIIRVPPTVRSVAFGKPPVWIRFRSTDSLPLLLTFRYTVP